MSFVFYISVVFSLRLFWSSLTLKKNLTPMNLTLEKHFMKLKKYKKSKLYIKFFQKIFFTLFNTCMKLFFTIVYI